MKRERLEVQTGIQRGYTLPYSWICTLSRVSLGPTPTDISTEDLLEARFFGPTEEVRIFRRDGVLHAAVCVEEPEDHVLSETYALQNQSLFGKTLTVHQIIDSDEDGQCYVSAVRLADWEGGKENG